MRPSHHKPPNGHPTPVEVETNLVNLVVSLKKTKSGHYQIHRSNGDRVKEAIHCAQRIIAARDGG